MQDCPPNRVAELLNAYLEADYRWEIDGQWRAVRIASLAPQLEAAFPEATDFAMLSAWNPQSVAHEEAFNRARDAELRDAIAEGGYPMRPAFASAPDRSWREPSWMVTGMPVDALDRLARRFGQLGTIAWTRGQPVHLRMDAAAPAGLAGRAFVDWLR